MTRNDLESFFPDHPQAVDLLMDVWDVMQAWDDAYDGDPADHHDGYTKALVKLPENPVYNSCCVSFLIAQCYYDWMTANEFEEVAQNLNKSYMLRAGYFRIIISLVHLLRGSKIAAREASVIWRMYTEYFNEYRQEIEDHARIRFKQSSQGAEKSITRTDRAGEGDGTETA